MKKFLTVLVLLFSLAFVSACDNGGNDDNNGNGKDDNGSATDEFWDKDGNGIPDWQEKEITLKYATWQYTNPEMITIDVVMIDKFMEKYPNITVEMQVVGEDYEWDENFLGLLESNNLPDVFLVRRLESFLPFNILADITDYYEHDPDTNFIFPSVKDLGVYAGRRFAIPTFIYPKPWFINLDLLDAASISKPKYDWTVEQMISIAKGATNQANHIYGMTTENYFTREYPKVLKIKQNAEVGKSWYSFSFDGEKFNFDDPVMLTGANQMRESIDQNYNKPGFSDEELEEWYGRPDFIPTYGGKVAIWSEATWSIKDHFEEMNFNWDVYPGPNLVTGGNTDISGVSALSANKDAAYQLLKWMSFGEEGILSRFEIYEESGQELYQQANNFPYPIVDYGLDSQGVNKIWESIPYGEVAKGFVAPEFLEGLRNGAYWANKEVIGWDAVNSATNEYFYDIISGETDYASVMDAIVADADRAFADAIEAMRDMLGF